MMSGTHDFGDKETRKDDMSDAIETWVSDLANSVEDARTSEEFIEYLDVMANFHSYSRNNQALIAMQKPNATRVAGFNTWKDDYNRTVKKGESAIWIWAPITARKCPDCGNSKSYHNNSDCEGDTDTDEWNTGIVGFRAVPVFDVSQTEGEPLPRLDTDAHGDADGLADALTNAAEDLGIPSVTITPSDEWGHGIAKGTSHRETGDVDILDRDNAADKAVTIAHEYAHTLLHAGNAADPSKDDGREVEAEAVAYVVGRHFGLDVSGSSLYLASWTGDNPEEITKRLDRISKTAKQIIAATESNLEPRNESAHSEPATA